MIKVVNINELLNGDIIMIGIEHKDEPVILTVDRVVLKENKIYPVQLEPAIISLQPYGDIIRIKVSPSGGVKRMASKLEIKTIGTAIDLKIR